MAFTDVEMAILSQCAYYKFPDGTEGQLLYDFLKKHYKSLKSKLGDNYNEALDGLLNKVRNKNYVIVQCMDDKDGSGFAAFAIQDPNQDVTVACRGTEGFSLDYDSRKDVYADIQLAVTLQTCQQEKMAEFMAELQKGGYDNYYFTGHSLGGNLAMYGAICLEDPDKLGKVVTFNAPGFNSAFLTLNAIRIAELQNRFTNYQNERDGVSSSFTVPGNVVILECDGWDVLNPVGVNAHMLDKFVINSDGTFKRNHTGKKDITVISLILGGVTLLSDVVMLALLPGTVIYDFAKWTVQKVAKWVHENSAGYKYATANPKITVDTYKLTQYASRLQEVNRRIARLDGRLDSLYWQVGLLGLWNLMQADLLTGYSWKLLRAASYLNETASDFSKAEQELMNSL